MTHQFTTQDVPGRDDSAVAPIEAPEPASHMGARAAAVTFSITLYLLGTSRWGSYIGPPGITIYVGDLAIGIAGLLLLTAIVQRTVRLQELTNAPLAVLFAVTLVGYAVVRFSFGVISVDSLRDFAPYAYASAALLAYMQPLQDKRRWTLAIYGALALHAAWTVLLPFTPGFPWGLPTLGSDATVFVARPDFDSMVLGITAALAGRELVQPPRWPQRKVRKFLLVLLAFVCWYGVVSLSTRAGLLSALAAAGVALLTRSSRVDARSHRTLTSNSAARRIGLPVVLLVFGAVLAVSPTGARIVDSFEGGGTQAAGTIAVRGEVWRNVTSYIVRSPHRTALGVGFGRNFIAESGSQNALEGTTYTNVRSPHNYLVGTLARLGVGGALLAMLVILLGWRMALISLTHRPGTITLLAALVAVSTPVVALLGVVLEAPFGAIPYFWALGHLAAVIHGRDNLTPDPGTNGRHAQPRRPTTSRSSNQVH